MTRDEAERWLRSYLHTHYPAVLYEDLEISETPGYWTIRTPCSPGGCHSPLHGYLFNDGPVHHTVSYAEWGARGERGRWVSPYRVWRALGGQR